MNIEEDYLRPFPRYLEPHYKRMDRIGTVLGSIILAVIVVCPTLIMVV